MILAFFTLIIQVESNLGKFFPYLDVCCIDFGHHVHVDVGLFIEVNRHGFVLLFMIIFIIHIKINISKYYKHDFRKASVSSTFSSSVFGLWPFTRKPCPLHVQLLSNIVLGLYLCVRNAYLEWSWFVFPYF